VHLQQMGKNENKRGKDAIAKIQRQREATESLMRHYGIQANSHL